MKRSIHGIAVGVQGRELGYVVVSLVFLAAGISSVWFVQSVLDVKGDAILVAILVVPLLLYLTLSGQVGEIGAGSLTVKLREVSREPVQGIQPQAVITELGPQFDPSHPLILKTDPNRVHFVTLSQGGGPYERDQVLQWLRNIAATSPVPFLIVLDDRGRVLAYMTYRSALDLLDREGRGDQFIGLVNAGDPDVFDDGGGFSAVLTETLPSNATNAEALRTMEETGLDALVVVDRKSRFDGIVERDRVLSKMMLALVSPSSVT